MKSTEYKVLITTSGVGTGLGELTKYTNKTLIPIGQKPVIAHIIDAYPKDTRFVITLGHFASHIKEFLTLAYPNRIFEFVIVSPYDGEGSSLGYSMLQTEKYLQVPFIYHASDTIVTDRIPQPTKNWIAGFNGDGSSDYTSFNVLNGKIQRIMEKGIMNPDFLHVGLVGIYDFQLFWESLHKLYKKPEYKGQLSDIHVWNDLISQGVSFHVHEIVSWYDTGNVNALKKAQKHFSDGYYNLEKLKESICIQDKKTVIKFYFDKNVVRERVERANFLRGLVPKIKGYTDNFFSYQYVSGQLYAEVATSANFIQFLAWAKENLWYPINEVSKEEFTKRCFDFYHTKTKERIQNFLETRNVRDNETIINGEKVPSVDELLQNIDFTWLSTADQTMFHGDFILDNIIKTNKGFCLLDWRQNFGGLLKAGDLYYDLAKLHHNLIINHRIIDQGLYQFTKEEKEMNCDIFRRENLIQCQNQLYTFLRENNYDERKVRILSCLIWFSSSPLHHYPYDYFLFYFAKLNLWRILNEKK